MKQNKKRGKVKASQKFVTALALVSILGFLAIFLEAFFEFDINDYLETGLMVVIGFGLLFEADFSKLKRLKKKGFDNNSFGSLILIVLGCLAVIAGILSLPQIALENPAFKSIKGIISIIAILFIAIQTWVVDSNLNGMKK